MLRLLFSFVLVALGLSLSAQSSPADTAVAQEEATVIEQRLRLLLQDPLLEQAQLGAYVYDLTNDRPLFASGQRQRMRPASTMKVLTAVVGLDLLGGSYQLATRLYATAALADTLRGDVIVQGGMDPLLSHDDVVAMVSHLQRAGVRTIAGNLVLDLSMKDDRHLGWGWCWDDDEARLNPLLYGGEEVFVERWLKELERVGITLQGSIKEARVPSGAQLLAMRGHGIAQVLGPMMKRSDNLFAESLFYQIAAHDKRPYASRKEAERHFNAFIQRLRLNPSDYTIADGSGLSLYNYLSPELLVMTLRYAYGHEAVYDGLLPSLPVMGRDGTLQSRGRGTSAQGRVMAKTGTVSGITSLAGYATTASGRQLAFAFILQGVRRAAQGRRWIDAACTAMTARVSEGMAAIPLAQPAEEAENDSVE